MTGLDYPMCPDCRRADVGIRLALEDRKPCPYCGGVLWAERPVCCMPDCSTRLPLNHALPLCRPCGVKVAIASNYDATMHDAVRAEQYRLRTAAKEARRAGLTDTSVVYYARLDESRVKIGFTSKLFIRMRDMRVLPENVLAVEPGGRELERQRHQQFIADRIKGEEFRPSETLLAWTETMVAEHGKPQFPIDTKKVTVRRKE